jgi:hypothetical protein
MKTYKEGRDITLLDTIYPGKSPGAQWIGGWVGSRIHLDSWKKEYLASVGIRTPECPPLSTVVPCQVRGSPYVMRSG